MAQPLKFGFDIHGVLNANPIIMTIAKALILYGKMGDKGVEIHIISGSPLTAEMRTNLEGLWTEHPHQWWDEYFSIQTFLDDNYEQDSEGSIEQRKCYPDEVWDSVKAEYCKDRGIDIHFDDSIQYLGNFETNCFLYMNKKS